VEYLRNIILNLADLIFLSKAPKQNKSNKSKQHIPRTIVESSSPYSITRIAKLRYAQEITLGTSTSNNASAVLSATSAYAPSVGSYTAGCSYTTAHQPKGWDEWTAFYNDYAVLKSKIQVRVIPNNLTNPLSSAGIIAITLSDSNSAFSVCTSALEDGKTKFKPFSVNTSANPISVSHSYDAKRFFNVKDVIDNMSRIGANTSASPSENAYFLVHFFTADPASSTSTGPLCWITIDYEIMFTSPKNLPQS
jgi:hypothetical protein